MLEAALPNQWLKVVYSVIRVVEASLVASPQVLIHPQDSVVAKEQAEHLAFKRV